MNNDLVPKVRPRSRYAIELKARAIVEAHHPETMEGASFPIGDFCEFELEDLMGVSFAVEDLVGEEGKLVDKTLILSADTYHAMRAGDRRARFTTAHEAGHAVLHSTELTEINDGRRGKVKMYRRRDLKPYLDPEWQANEFAGAILMPGEAVELVANETNATDASRLKYDLCELFGVSLSAAQTRIANLKKQGYLKGVRSEPR